MRHLKRRLSVEQMEERRLLTATVYAPPTADTESFSGYVAYGLEPGESVDFDIDYSDQTSESGGSAIADINGVARGRDNLDVTGLTTIMATGNSVSTVDVTVVSSHSGTFSSLDVIAPASLTAGGINNIYTEGWLPDGDLVYYDLTWPDGSTSSGVDAPYANGVSYDQFYISPYMIDGTADLTMTQGTTTLTHQFQVGGGIPVPPDPDPNEDPEPGQSCTTPTLEVPRHIIPGESYDVTGECWTERAYIHIIQDGNDWYEGSDAPNSSNEISEGISVDDEVQIGTALIQAWDEDDNVLFSKTTNVVWFIPTVTPPSSSVEIAEGDSFMLEVEDGIEFGTVELFVVGDNDQVLWEFQPRELDDRGEGILTYQMPGNMVDQEVDGRTLRLSHAGFVDDYLVPVHEGLRMSMDDSGHEEGSDFSPAVRNGIGVSQIIWQLVNQDTGDVVHEFSYQTTDGSGVWGDDESLDLPQVLPADSKIDVYTLRMIHGGTVIDTDIVIEEGLRVVTGNSKMREGDDFHVEVRNADDNGAIDYSWWNGGTEIGFGACTQANGDGYQDITITTPDLVSGGGSENLTLRVTVSGETFELDYEVFDALEPTPDPGDEQSESSVTEIVNGLNTFDVDSVWSVANKIVKGETLDQAIVDIIRADEVTFEQVESAVYAQKSGLPIWQSFVNLILGIEDAHASGPAPAHMRDPSFLLKERDPSALVVLFHGKGQESGETAGDGREPGMDAVERLLDGKVARVITVESGNPTTYPGDRDLAEAIVAGTVAGGQYTHVVFAGYSWGGGLAQELADYFEPSWASQNIELTGVALIDAVDHGGSNAENNYPGDAKAILNLYQNVHANDDSPLRLNGGELDDTSHLDPFEGTYVGSIMEVEVDKFDDRMVDHYDIDNIFARMTSQWILSLLDERIGS